MNHMLTKRTRYCGSHLTNTLSMVCRGRYPSYDKKSYGDGFSYNEYEGDYNDISDNDVDFPFLSKEYSRFFVPQKIRRGIVDECCHKPCSINELRNYCGK
ncbi:LIRP-like [Anoplophora glabripennis]|uniref:LIRP-like n=1 Tax=Anoplophora glabripennis TaxID=217634 RepID=UPI000874B8CE|nr:LIRP-like [Anoplophora glabripennis]